MTFTIGTFLEVFFYLVMLVYAIVWAYIIYYLIKRKTKGGVS